MSQKLLSGVSQELFGIVGKQTLVTNRSHAVITGAWCCSHATERTFSQLKEKRVPRLVHHLDDLVEVEQVFDACQREGTFPIERSEHSHSTYFLRDFSG